jgi:hypothetical protein
LSSAFCKTRPTSRGTIKNIIQNRGSDELRIFPFPWDNARMTKARSQGPKPQRGLSIQPGVAQHACGRATLGISRKKVTTPKGLEPSRTCWSLNATPSGLREISQQLPRVDRCAVNRWAERWNAFGVPAQNLKPSTLSNLFQSFPNLSKALGRGEAIYVELLRAETCLATFRFNLGKFSQY